MKPILSRAGLSLSLPALLPAGDRPIPSRAGLSFSLPALLLAVDKPILSRAGLRLALLALLLAGHPAVASPYAKHEAPIPAATLALMRNAGTTPASPLLIRLYKKEAELEVWKRSPTAGRYVLIKTFPICRWSGDLGPKKQKGDRQAPEGFYAVTPGLMNPNSAHYLSFDTGFPNAYNRAHGASGSALMVHGTCSSAGCYAMTDEGISEIYALMREAFEGGQKAVQFQAYPFRMNAENLVRHRLDPNIAFWRQLKEGSDRFEATGQEPQVTVRAGRYAFLPFAEPGQESAVAAYRQQEEDHVAALIKQGHPAVRTTYADGGQHPIFRLLARQGVDLGDISQPQALAYAGREVPLTPASAGAAAGEPSDEAAAPVIRAAATAPPPPLRREASGALRESLASAERSGWLSRLTRAVQTDPEEAPPRESFASASRGAVGRDIVYPPSLQGQHDIVYPPGYLARANIAYAPSAQAPSAQAPSVQPRASAAYAPGAEARREVADPPSVPSRANVAYPSSVQSRRDMAYAPSAQVPRGCAFYGSCAPAPAARSPRSTQAAAARAPQRWWESN